MVSSLSEERESTPAESSASESAGDKVGTWGKREIRLEHRGRGRYGWNIGEEGDKVGTWGKREVRLEQTYTFGGKERYLHVRVRYLCVHVLYVYM